MPSLKALKNRIGSVKNTRKITKAMQMVAAAKLRRAQDAAEAARPYADRMAAVMAGLTANAAGSSSAPRLLAGIVALPLLVVVADILGIAGGFLVGTVKLGFNPGGYLQSTADILTANDVVSGLVKAAVFGLLIALMGCYHGYNSRGGAQGVGSATTSAVVAASILILAFDYVLTELFFAR